MAAGGFTLAFVRLIANAFMSTSGTTPPNTVGMPSSLAAIRAELSASELIILGEATSYLPPMLLPLLKAGTKRKVAGRIVGRSAKTRGNSKRKL
jgi:hypothetical protein